MEKVPDAGQPHVTKRGRKASNNIARRRLRLLGAGFSGQPGHSGGTRHASAVMAVIISAGARSAWR
eukprot:5893743-Pyramimonas_sp.AAC.1